MSLVCLVATESDFASEDSTRLVTDQNAALNIKGGGDKSMGAEGEVGLPMLGVVVGL